MDSNIIKSEYINRLKEYVKTSKESHITINKFKVYDLNIFYNNRHNLSFNISPKWIENNYYKILNVLFPKKFVLN